MFRHAMELTAEAKEAIVALRLRVSGTLDSASNSESWLTPPVEVRGVVMELVKDYSIKGKPRGKKKVQS